MAGPIDYTIQQPNIAGSLLGGIQAGQQFTAQQAAQDKHQQYVTDLQAYLAAPSARSASAMMAKYPESQKAMAASFDTYDKGQKEDIFKTGTQAYSAIQNGKPEVAMKLLDDRIAAAENAGQDTADLVSLKQSMAQDPKAAGAGLALTMSALNPEGWSKIASEQRAAAMAPSELTESQAKATKAGVDAKYAESNAAKDLEKKGWDIWKIGQDAGIARQNSQIAAMNAETSRLGNNIKQEGNNLKLQELQLKVQDKIAARDAAVNQKASEVSSARSTIDNLLNTADRVLQTNADIIESATGPVSSRLPTLSGDTADFEELLNTLGAQTFLAQIPSMKSMGALSEKEGDKLQASLTNLSIRQSPERLKENVKEAQRLMLKARDNLSVKYGVPDITPDTPASQPAPDVINSLVDKYTRPQ